MSREIPVDGSPNPAICDDADYDYLSQFQWFAVEINGKTHAGRLVLMEEDVMNQAALQS